MIKELLEFEILEIDAASEYWKECLPNLGQDWQISSFSIFGITSEAQQWIISQISEFIFPVVTKVDQFFIFSISLNFFPWNFLGLKISHFSFFWIHFSCFSDFDILFCARSWHEPLFIHRSSLWRSSWQHRHTQRAARISLWCGLIQSFIGGAFGHLSNGALSKFYLNDGKKKLLFWQFFGRNPLPPCQNFNPDLPNLYL